MLRNICFLFTAVAMAGLLIASEPANAIEHRSVATVQFRSKGGDQKFCTGHQVIPNLFVTEARCLAADDGKINKFNEVEFTDDGLQMVEAFPIECSGLNSTVDNVLFLKSLVRFARDDEEGGEGGTKKPINVTSGAGTLLGNSFMIVSVLVLGL